MVWGKVNPTHNCLFVVRFIYEWIEINIKYYEQKIENILMEKNWKLHFFLKMDKMEWFRKMEKKLIREWVDWVENGLRVCRMNLSKLLKKWKKKWNEIIYRFFEANSNR